MKTLVYKFYYKAFTVFLALLVITSCSDDDEFKAPTYTSTPGEALLNLPLNNQECEIGEVIDDQATVTFSWNESEATENYNLTITNLITQDVTLNVGLETNTTVVRLTRGYPYSWMVTSRNSGGTTTNSEVWKFYLAGDGESNNVPFPATLLSPLSGAIVAPVDGKVTLEWEGSDSDGDAITFTLFADTVDGNQTPPVEWQNITETSVEILVEPNTVYFWHVETSDGRNTSISQTLTFKTGTPPEGTVVATSQEILDAISAAVSGEIIYIRGGDYVFNSTIDITKSGVSGSTISLVAYPGDSSRPKFDFSSMSESSSNRGIQLEGSYWHIKGIDVFGAGDNGMFIRGHHNLIEFCTFSENSDTGLQIGNGGSNNTILNCDSYFNADSTLENADGFASKLDAGTNNKFIGCRAWQNLDDGWDGYMRGNDNITTYYENCWAFKNGILKDGSTGSGDGNGFKTGGSDDKLLKHNAIYNNCIAAGNVFDGFDHNSNRGDITIYNCSAYDNGRNISFSSTNPANALIIKNSVSLDGNSNDSFNATTTDITNNSWQNGLSADASDFVSLNMDLLSSPRNADGSLPDIDFMNLVNGSDLIDGGVDVGLPYNGSAPDLGAFEYE
ncbi:right-handed parallel beta-helix repeat-containing protein [Aestuariivivens sediminicola]|uniref:right-handed parallel beta-helix repeat-containing protein n=1 Tax=Aestuariivivens sediminicola TaxID=2913560 RepID=UPI001F584BCD|nr:right-handed parallel beta-helix repeat-containing protein [Aestuariivivens sediminicola]